jgi:hypothetical protein
VAFYCVLSHYFLSLYFLDPCLFHDVMLVEAVVVLELSLP